MKNIAVVADWGLPGVTIPRAGLPARRARCHPLARTAGLLIARWPCFAETVHTETLYHGADSA